MTINPDKVWKMYFGNSPKAIDAFGYEIIKDEYANNYNNSKKGAWTLDHIFPKNPLNDNSKIKRYGWNHLYNIQPLSIKSNRIKESKLNGKVNNITFAIKIIEQNGNKVIGRMMIKKKGVWYWAYG